MNHKKIKKTIATALSGICLAGVLNVPVFASTDIAVSLGNDLTSSQKEDMLNEFGVSKNDEDVTVINITVDDIREQLGLGPATSTSSKSNSYSSSYVKIEKSGYGIKVATNNLTEVTGTMLQNALLTSGITNADVKASSPFPVTGTAALAGILKGFEDATGEELSLNQKEVAKEEIGVTNSLSNATKEDGDTLGKDEAALVINEIKTQVIKDSPKTDIAIDRIVTNVFNNYNINLTSEEKSEVVTLMSNINNLDFDYSEMKNSLKQMTDSIKESLNEAGKNLEESGLIEKLWNKIKTLSSTTWDAFCSITNRAKALIVGIDNVIIEKDGVQYDINGNILGLANDDEKSSSSETSSSTSTIDNNKDSEASDEIITDTMPDSSKDKNSSSDDTSVSNSNENVSSAKDKETSIQTDKNNISSSDNLEGVDNSSN